jgi:myosin heavy subunit
MTAAGSDAKFASRMITELSEYSRLAVSDKHKVAQKFCINHYAGEVVYSTKTFVVCATFIFLQLRMH